MPKALAIRTELISRALEYVKRSQTPNTERAYTSDLHVFGEFLDEHGVSRTFPVAPEVLALYLTHLATLKRKAATIRRAMYTISRAQRRAGFPSLSDAPQVHDVLEGIEKVHGTAQRRAPALTTELLVLLASHCGNNLLGVRDRALILVGWGAAFRSSELVSLNWEGAVDHGEKGYLLFLERSKTDTKGEGDEPRIARARTPENCPVLALEAWRDACGTPTKGAIFRSVHGTTLGPRLWPEDVSRRIKHLCKRSGLDSKAFSSHSLRAGVTTSAAIAGRPEWLLRRKGRWKSNAMLARYIRLLAQTLADDAAEGLL